MRDLPRYPLTTLVAVSSVGATLAWWRDRDVGWMLMTTAGLSKQPWRPFTSTLLHADVLHLAFNVYWLWVFGSAFEAAFGRLRLAGIFFLLAAGSSVAQFAMSAPGVGLSGVGYGLFAAAWVLSKRDPRFRNVVDRSTVTIFVAWGLFCVATTVLGLMEIGNWAHGAGAALGALLAAAVTAHGPARAGFAAGLAAALLAIGLATSVGRPWLNRSQVAQELAHEGWLTLDRNDDARAAELLSRALELDSRRPDWWINLGIAEQRRNRLAEALDAYERARALGGPPRPEIDRTACELAVRLGNEDLEAGRVEAALARGRIAVAAGPGNAQAWLMLGFAEHRAGNSQSAVHALEKALAIDAQSWAARAALERIRSGKPLETWDLEDETSKHAEP